MDKKKLTRRTFIQSSSALAGGMAVGMSAGILRAETKGLEIKEYRPLGSTGFKVSDIGLGAGPLKDPALLKLALQKGINYIDTAQGYGKGASEETIGKVMKSWKKRDKVFITTKFSDAKIFDKANLKKNLKEALDLSLKRMNIDYVDSLFIHGIDGGRGNAAELKTAAAENPALYEFIDESVKAGKLKYFGLSSHDSHETLKTVLKRPEYYRVVLYPYIWAAEEGESLNLLKKCKKAGVGLTLMKTRTGCLNLKIKGVDKVEQDKENPYRSKFDKEYLENAIVYVNNQPLTDTTLVSIRTFEDLDWALAMSGRKYKA